MTLTKQEINKSYYQRHREEILAKARTPEERERKRAYDKEYYKTRSEKNKAKTKRWRHTHPEKVLEYREKYKERQKELYKTPKYKKMMAKSRLKYILNNPEKHQAHILLNQAVRRGDIQRKPCEVCSNPQVEGHHEDYTKPLEVIWLCRKCHYNHHKERRQNAA